MLNSVGVADIMERKARKSHVHIEKAAMMFFEVSNSPNGWAQRGNLVGWIWKAISSPSILSFCSCERGRVCRILTESHWNCCVQCSVNRLQGLMKGLNRGIVTAADSQRVRGSERYCGVTMWDLAVSAEWLHVPTRDREEAHWMVPCRLTDQGG